MVLKLITLEIEWTALMVQERNRDSVRAAKEECSGLDADHFRLQIDLLE